MSAPSRLLELTAPALTLEIDAPARTLEMDVNTVKRGDTGQITLTVKDDTGAPVDLTGFTSLRVLALSIGSTDPAIELLPVALGAGTGEVVHTCTGNLAVGTYNVEVEETSGGVKTTAPTVGYATLIVDADLG